MKVLDVWTIYDHPTDFPGYFVARLHLVADSTAVCTACHLKHVSLDSLRSMLPPGLVCIKRSDSDPLTIVESWV